MSQNTVFHILKAHDIEAMQETVRVHRLNVQAVRNTKSLSNLLGMTHLGIHLVRVEPGKETTEFHFHHQEEEFMYIISGRGVAEIGDEKMEVGPGDFLGFSAPSLPHMMTNPFDEDLVYLMGGERRNFDICDYPRLKKRLFKVEGKRQLVDWANMYEF